MLYRFIKFITIILTSGFEKKLLSKIKSTSVKPEIIVDAGAHIGEYSNLFYKNFPSIKKIYSFEPQKSIFLILKNNFKKIDKIQCIQKALGEKKEIKLFNEGYHKRSSTFLTTDKKSFFYKIKSFILFGKITDLTEKKNKVEVTTIDNYFKKKTNIDILKIDVEGYELNVLRGALNTIRENRIKVILIEITTHNLFKKYSSKKIENLLKKNNYNLFSRHKFPFYPFEDRIYVHKSLKMKI